MGRKENNRKSEIKFEKDRKNEDYRKRSEFEEKNKIGEEYMWTKKKKNVEDECRKRKK